MHPDRFPWPAARLSRAAEANLAERFDYIARRHPRMEVLEINGMRLVNSTFATDTFNVVFAGAQHECVDERVVRTVVTYFQERMLPFSWWVGPTSDIDALRPPFAAAGLHYAEGELAMAVRTETFTEPAPVSPVDVRRVHSRADLSAYAQTLAGLFDPPDTEVAAYYESTAELFLDDQCPARLWVGYLGGKAVATGELFVADGVGGVYNIATLPHARGRRIGSLLTWTALQEAKRLGLEYTILQATEEGRGVYERLGFQACGTFGEFKPARQPPLTLQPPSTAST